MAISFRSADSNDIDSCVEIFIETFRQPPWNEEWEEAITRQRIAQVFETPYFHGVIAESAGEVIGFAIGFREPWINGYVFYIKETCIHPSFQRTGTGTALMQFLSSQLQELHVQKIYLLTARGDSAEAFYQKLGFYTSGKMIMMGKYLTEG